MTKYKVVLIPFPFDDFSTTKVWPAVCLTEPISPLRHVVLAFVTSRVQDKLLATDVLIDAHDTDFALTGLHVSSTLQLHHLMTARTSLIRRELGQLPATLQTQVKQRLRALFELEEDAQNE